MTDDDVIFHSYPSADMSADEFEQFVVHVLQQTESEVESLDVVQRSASPQPTPLSREVALEMGVPVFVGHCYANGSIPVVRPRQGPRSSCKS